MSFEFLLQYGDWGLFALRLTVGAIFLYHGLPKIKNPRAMAEGMGVNAAMPLVLGLVEVSSALAVILGFYAQLGALLLAIVMVGAIWMKAMKWGVPFSATGATGWEFDLILLAANLAILTSSGGSIAIQ